jgi:hypothetical protein
MALVAEIGANVTGIGSTRLDRRFAEYVMERGPGGDAFRSPLKGECASRA